MQLTCVYGKKPAVAADSLLLFRLVVEPRT